MDQLTAEFKGVWIRGWNSYCPLLFTPIIQPMTENVWSSKDNHMCIYQYMYLWYQGHFPAMLENNANSVHGRREVPVQYSSTTV